VAVITPASVRVPAAVDPRFCAAASSDTGVPTYLTGHHDRCLGR